MTTARTRTRTRTTSLRRSEASLHPRCICLVLQGYSRSVPILDDAPGEIEPRTTADTRGRTPIKHYGRARTRHESR